MKRKNQKKNEKEMGQIFIILFLILGTASLIYSFVPEKQLSNGLIIIISLLLFGMSAIFYLAYWQDYGHPWPNLWKKIAGH